MTPRVQFTTASRLNSFKACPELFTWRTGPSDTLDLIARAATVPGLDSVMLNFPEHTGTAPSAALLAALAQGPLRVSGLNLRYPDNTFAHGGFTNPDPALRRRAIELTCAAADMCRTLGARHLVIWPAHDGFDYPFQLDYAQAWRWSVEAIQAVAHYAPDLLVSVEYKPSEPRRWSLLGDLGTTLLAVREADAPNLGVTLDFCHVLMANESPALAAALCLARNQLYGIHLNDGYRLHDDGLIIGSVNLMQTVELIDHLVCAAYAEVIYFDTFPVHADPVEECRQNITRLHQMVALTQRLNRPQLDAARDQQDALVVNRLFWDALLPT